MNGAISRVSVRRHSSSVANAAAPSGVPGPSQNRRRDRRTYQLDRSSMNAASLRPASAVSNPSSAPVTSAGQRVQLAQHPPVEQRPVRRRRRRASASRRRPAPPAAFAYSTKNDTVFQ